MIWSVLGLICIIVGFVSGIVDDKILIPPLEWFIAAIAFNTLQLVVPGMAKKE